MGWIPPNISTEGAVIFFQFSSSIFRLLIPPSCWSRRSSVFQVQHFRLQQEEGENYLLLMEILLPGVIFSGIQAYVMLSILLGF